MGHNSLGAGRKVAGYCRYSSNNQREESIEAQQQAIREYCFAEQWEIVSWYIDKAETGMSDERKQFQEMISDSALEMFDTVLVHKLDRFCREDYDRLRYKRILTAHDVILQSVCEQLEDTPVGHFMENVMGATNQYQSENIGIEVMKGLCVNARKCISTGGTCPFGYSLDPQSRTLVINENEAPGVRLIFQMVIDGYSYNEIQNELNMRGYRTKRGRKFGTNSLHDILKNEKYTGLYIYNKQASIKKGSKKRRSPHKLKDRSKWIIVENGIPAIISKADFEQVQAIMQGRKHKPGGSNAKQVYLLSGKLRCGECGSTYTGNRRKATERQKEYISYRCNRNQKTIPCKNREVSREALECNMLALLSNIVYDPQKLDDISAAYAQYHAEQSGSKTDDIARIEQQHMEAVKKIENTTTAIANCGGSSALLKKLSELEDEQRKLEINLAKAKQELTQSTIDPDEIRAAFHAAKRTFECGEMPEIKAIVQRMIGDVTVYPDRVEVSVNLNNKNLSSALSNLEEKNVGRSDDASAYGISPQYEGLVEQVKGIEPSYSAWKVRYVIFFPRCKSSQTPCIFNDCKPFFFVAISILFHSILLFLNQIAFQ